MPPIRLKFNPFIPDKTADPSRFEGRESELKTILTALNQTRFGSPSHVLILGERGIGKSSLLNYGERLAKDGVPEEKYGFNFLTVSLDLSGVKSNQAITRRVGRRLKEELRRHEPGRDGLKQIIEFLLKWKILGVEYDGKEEEFDADEALDDLIVQLLGIERTGRFHGIAILMDEADDPPVEARLASWCKSLTERYAKRDGSRLMLGLAGQLSLRATLYNDHQSFLRNLTSIVLSVLDQEERLEAIDAGLDFGNLTDDAQTTMDDKARLALADLSDGYPHFLQHYCYRAFEVDEDDHIDLDDVNSIRKSAIKEIGEKFFEQRFIAEIGSEDYRKLLRFLAPQGMEFVARKTMVDGSGINEKVIDNALRSLSENSFLLRDEQRKGMYRLPSNAFASWLQATEAD